MQLSKTNIYGNTGVAPSVTGTATGGQVTLTVPQGVKWILKAGTLTLVTGATVGNRNAQFIAFDSFGNQLAAGLPLGSSTAGENQGNNLTVAYSFGLGYNNFQTNATNGQFSFPFPELVLGPGFTVVTSVVNLQAVDTVTLTLNVIQVSD
jgi:hypothetical protein